MNARKCRYDQTQSQNASSRNAKLKLKQNHKNEKTTIFNLNLN